MDAQGDDILVILPKHALGEAAIQPQDDVKGVGQAGGIDDAICHGGDIRPIQVLVLARKHRLGHAQPDVSSEVQFWYEPDNRFEAEAGLADIVATSDLLAEGRESILESVIFTRFVGGFVVHIDQKAHLFLGATLQKLQRAAWNQTIAEDQQLEAPTEHLLGEPDEFRVQGGFAAQEPDLRRPRALGQGQRGFKHRRLHVVLARVGPLSEHFAGEAVLATPVANLR